MSHRGLFNTHHRLSANSDKHHRIVINIILGDGMETSWTSHDAAAAAQPGAVRPLERADAVAGPRTVEDLPTKLDLDEDGPGGQHATFVTAVDESACKLRAATVDPDNRGGGTERERASSSRDRDRDRDRERQRER